VSTLHPVPALLGQATATTTAQAKAVTVGYFIDDSPLEEKVSGQTFTSLFGGGSLPCVTMGGVCTGSSNSTVCPAGSSVGYAYGHAFDEGGDCPYDDVPAVRCCGSAQQLWAQEGVLAIDVPSSSQSDIPDSLSDDDVLEIRLAAEFKLVLQSLGVPDSAFQYRLPALPRAQQLKAGEKPKPVKRPAGTNGGNLDIPL
jgi:hypothetical protein